LKRTPSRASAVRDLLKRALVAEGFEVAADGSHSKDFGLSTAEQPDAKMRIGCGPQTSNFVQLGTFNVTQH
jgi:hypothetical protein